MDPTAPCHVFWAGGTKEYTSVILIASGLTFLAQAIVFIAVGSLADFGNWSPWVVRGFSVLSWAFEFGFLGVKDASKWRISMALYILSGESHRDSYFRGKLLIWGIVSYHLLGVIRLLQRHLPKTSP